MDCPIGESRTPGSWVAAAFTVLGSDACAPVACGAGGKARGDAPACSCGPAPHIVLAAWRRQHRHACPLSRDAEWQDAAIEASFEPPAPSRALALIRAEPTRALALRS